MSEPRGRRLTRRDFDAVIRRAAELSSSDPGEGALTEDELFRIAGEVGLDARHVRRALDELRSGAAPGGSTLDRLFGPELVQAARPVPGSPRELAAKLDDFLVASQLLQSVRRGPTLLQYRPAVDWASQIARAASFTSRKYYIAAASSVEIRLEEQFEGRTLVEIVVDPGTRGDDALGALIGGGTAGVVTGAGAGVGLAWLDVIAGGAVATGTVVGLGMAGAVTYAVGRAHKKKLAEVRAEVEGVLDALEAGDSLEPPPPSWRRWVKRQFHGVAHDLAGTDLVDDGEAGARRGAM